DAHPGKVASASIAPVSAKLSFSWQSVRCLTFVRDDKPSIAAAGEQQRLLAIVRIRLDRAKEDHMVATIVAVDGSALEIGDALGEHRRAAKTGLPVDSDKLVIRGLGEFVGKRLLGYAEH